MMNLKKKKHYGHKYVYDKMHMIIIIYQYSWNKQNTLHDKQTQNDMYIFQNPILQQNIF